MPGEFTVFSHRSFNLQGKHYFPLWLQKKLQVSEASGLLNIVGSKRLTCKLSSSDQPLSVSPQFLRLPN
jgi:hypothetical protein